MHFVETIKINSHLTKVYLHDIERMKDGSGTLEVFNHARMKLQTVDFSLKGEVINIEAVIGSQPFSKAQYNDLEPYLKQLIQGNPVKSFVLV